MADPAAVLRDLAEALDLRVVIVPESGAARLAGLIGDALDDVIAQGGAIPGDVAAVREAFDAARKRRDERAATSAVGTRPLPQSEVGPSCEGAESSWLTVDEAAARLQVTGRWVRGLIDRGQLSATKAGAMWLIPTEAFKEYERWRSESPRS